MVASLMAAPIGAKIGQKINAVYLQWALAVMITATAIKIWVDLL
ncbi:sulfite exporter TauE/SafE family protein, partial [Bacillus subtilis]|nr:sulfite exporter TauE/SafE family protein [Bacillus subtilis]